MIPLFLPAGGVFEKDKKSFAIKDYAERESDYLSVAFHWGIEIKPSRVSLIVGYAVLVSSPIVSCSLSSVITFLENVLRGAQSIS